MISMSQIATIRQRHRQGEEVSKIAREVGVSRGTVYKYIAAADLSPEPPVRPRRGRILDPYRPLIESWLDSDRATWPKQRHTAHRIWARLAEEEGVRVGESTVREYVRTLKAERRGDGEGFLDLDWAPGAAQADFGEVLALPQNQPNAPLYPAGGAPGSRPGALPHFGRPRYLGPPPRARSTAG